MPETKDGKIVRSQTFTTESKFKLTRKECEAKTFYFYLKKSTIYENKAKMLRTIKAQFQIAKL